MIRSETWSRFSSMLDLRLSRSVFTTEDAVRYTFFTALLEEQGIRPEEVVLEHRHPELNKAQMDTWIPSLNGVGVAMEFKYDRQIPSGKNAPRTQKAGKIFQDLYRLGRLSATVRRVFVYLASSEMRGHFLSEKNGLVPFFTLPQGRSILLDESFVLGKARSFTSSLSGVLNVEVSSLHAAQLAQGHELRVYEVCEVSAAKM